MPTKYIISKHTKKIQKGTVPFCIIFATFPVNDAKRNDPFASE
jgi:hypothetical protein